MSLLKPTMKRGGSRPPNSYGFINPRQIEEMWRDEFDWVYWEMDDEIFPTIHPDVSGRPQVLLLERLIGHINAHSGVGWQTMEEIAEGFRRRQPFKAHYLETVRRSLTSAAVPRGATIVSLRKSLYINEYYHERWRSR